MQRDQGVASGMPFGVGGPGIRQRRNRRKRRSRRGFVHVSKRLPEAIALAKQINNGFKALKDFEIAFSVIDSVMDHTKLDVYKTRASEHANETGKCLKAIYDYVEDIQTLKMKNAYEHKVGVKLVLDYFTSVIDNISKMADSRIYNDHLIIEEVDQFLRKTYKATKRLGNYNRLLNQMIERIIKRRSLLQMDNTEQLLNTLSKRAENLFRCGFAHLAVTQFCPKFLSTSSIIKELIERMDIFRYEIQNLMHILHALASDRKHKIQDIKMDLEQYVRKKKEYKDTIQLYEFHRLSESLHRSVSSVHITESLIPVHSSFDNFISHFKKEERLLPLHSSHSEVTFPDKDDHVHYVNLRYKHIKPKLKTFEVLDFWREKTCDRIYSRAVMNEIRLGGKLRRKTDQLIEKLKNVEKVTEGELIEEVETEEENVADGSPQNIYEDVFPSYCCFCETDYLIPWNVKKLNIEQQNEGGDEFSEISLYIKRLIKSVDNSSYRLRCVHETNGEFMNNLVENFKNESFERQEFILEQIYKLDDLSCTNDNAVDTTANDSFREIREHGLSTYADIKDCQEGNISDWLTRTNNRCGHYTEECKIQ
ncbi:hypothetical protein GJ496_008643 [Pomphorhynchus laevis]|nr:hypothetical protein GJ496_008643 [Pomphorhynchus laevis]